MAIPTRISRAALFLVCVCLGGCESDTSLRQQVPIDSYPQGATVRINRKVAGTTPMVATLKRKRVHHVELELEDYHAATEVIQPVSVTGELVVQPLEQVGVGLILMPQAVQKSLLPAIVPKSYGVDPAGDYARKILKADRALREGEISPDIHRYWLDRLIEFYSTY